MKQTYASLRQDLDEVVAKLQNQDVDIDTAIELHAEATKIIKQLEEYLKITELKVKKITDSHPKAK